MRLDHPIFHEPLPVTLGLEEVETPDYYRAWPGGAALPGRLPVWRVQQADRMPIDSRGFIADPYGFEDSPDAEWISSGVNSKSYRSLALGRQANLFYWGFCGSPVEMTESARRVFVNTIVYMRRFAGHTPLVRREAASREWAQIYVSYVRSALGGEGVAGLKVIQNLRKYFPDEIADGLEMDLERLERYYEQNLEYLRPAERGFLADPDLVALRQSNRDPAFLDRMAGLLAERSENDPQLRRLFQHYLPKEAPREPEAFARWLAENRSRLFFSDVGGFRWFLRH